MPKDINLSFGQSLLEGVLSAASFVAMVGDIADNNYNVVELVESVMPSIASGNNLGLRQLESGLLEMRIEMRIVHLTN